MTTTDDTATATITPIAKRRPSAATRKAAATAKAAAPKKTAAKVTPKPPAKVVKKSAPAELTPTAMKRIVATAMAKCCADMLDKWNPKTHQGITREFAADVIAASLNYAPIPADGWDPRLPDRSNASGRGAKNRKSACSQSGP